MFRTLASLAVLAALLSVVIAQEAPPPASNPEAKAPEKQPEKGPGSAEYAHAEVEITEGGEGGKHYWLYTPTKPHLEKAPVVVFLHGWGGLKPEIYGAWLSHLCRRGNIVIFPQYQADMKELITAYAPNAAAAIVDALGWLEADKKRTQPEREQFALAGHSAGGFVAANLASDYEKYKLPKPRACMPVEPGVTEAIRPLLKRGKAEWAEFGNIPEGCLLLCVYGDSDNVVGWWIARKIFMDAAKVKKGDKNLVELRSDVWGKTPLVADHMAPVCGGERAGEHVLDALDWALWRLLDALCDAAFRGQNREYALGDTEEQKFMGKWSDGKAVRTLKVWLGNESVDPDETFQPVYKHDGTPWEAKDKPERPKLPRRERGDKEEGK
jgi:acetyl esterase/lipase